MVDAHNHLGAAFGGEWAGRSAAELVATLDASGVEAIVDLDGGQGEALSAEIERWAAAAPDRVVVVAGLDPDAWATDPSFGETEAAQLRDSVARGARGLKVWKTLGLRARDPDGRLVAVDDPRLDPLWAAAAELGIPVVIHIADPVAFFEPLDPTNERWEELRAHPDWHFWPVRPDDDPDAPGVPGVRRAAGGLRAARRGAIRGRRSSAPTSAAPPRTWRCVAGCSTSTRTSTSTSRRGSASSAASRTPTRAFFLRYADRILFGADMGPDPATYAIHYRFLETFDESFDYGTDPVPAQGRWQIHGIGLPDDVLRKVYRDNARRLFAMGPA